MKRALPLWMAAVVPASLAGHYFAYAVSGRTASDPQHAYVVGTLECSLVFLALLCCGLLANALLKAGIIVHTAAERSAVALWPRLALAQIVVFCFLERMEGTHPGFAGCVVQIAVAAAVAYALSVFSRLLVRCAAGSESAYEHLQLCLAGLSAALFIPRRSRCTAEALAVCAGSARFKRPPPIG